jgi:hypothetical protein
MKRQAKALGTYARVIGEAVNNTAGVQTVRTTQPTTQLAQIVTYQNLGKCFCVNTDYPFNPSGGQCGCGSH